VVENEIVVKTGEEIVVHPAPMGALLGDDKP